jgi:hypothetical protein
VDEEMDLKDIFRSYAYEFVWILNSAEEHKKKEEKMAVRGAIGSIAEVIALEEKNTSLLEWIGRKIEKTKKWIEERARKIEEDKRARMEKLRTKLEEKLKQKGFTEVFMKVEEREDERVEHRRVQGEKNYIVNIRYVCEDGKWHVDRIDVEPIS